MLRRSSLAFALPDRNFSIALIRFSIMVGLENNHLNKQTKMQSKAKNEE